MTAPWTPRERRLRGALEATPCRCSKAIKNTCPTCGETLVAATPSPYLNSYQWDAIKAGDWFCNTCEDTSIRNGKKHWHDRELETITYQQCGRCAALADQPPPDPRDEALRLAEEVMGSCVGRLDGIPDETGNVVDCVSQLSAALAAIAAAKGEK